MAIEDQVLSLEEALTRFIKQSTLNLAANREDIAAVRVDVASVYLEPSVIAFLNRQKLYGIAMGDEVKEVVNLGRF